MTTIPAEPPSTLVEFKGVTKRYGRGGRVVLDDFSHRFVRGETHFICGRSGAGKSTLIRCINGLEDIESGIIEIEGEELHHRSVRAVRRRVAMVFQDFNLFPHLSVAKNLCVGPMHTLGRSKADSLETAHRYLTVVGMSEYADVRPNSLSGGQKQRVAIARALCMGPDLILFDEPTSALDPESVGGVLEVMKSLAAEGRSMIVVSHEMGFARDAADLISFLEDGKFVQTSPPDEFFGAPATPSVARFLEQIRK